MESAIQEYGISKSELMSAYNKYRSMSKKYNWDKERIDRAFGILQQKGGLDRAISEYHPSDCTCGCKDFEFRLSSRRKVNGVQYNGCCKHQFALGLLNFILKNR